MSSETDQKTFTWSDSKYRMGTQTTGASSNETLDTVDRDHLRTEVNATDDLPPPVDSVWSVVVPGGHIKCVFQNLKGKRMTRKDEAHVCPYNDCTVFLGPLPVGGHTRIPRAYIQYCAKCKPPPKSARKKDPEPNGHGSQPSPR